MQRCSKSIRQKRYKRTGARLAFLAKLNQVQSATQRIGLTLQKEAISAQALMWSEQLTENQLAEALAENGDIRFQNWCFNHDYQYEKTQQILTALATYHEQHNDQLGLSKARLYRIATLNQPENLIYHLLKKCLMKANCSRLVVGYICLHTKSNFQPKNKDYGKRC